MKMQSALYLTLTLGLALSSFACSPQSPRLVAPITNASAVQYNANRTDNEINNKVDILFVVDHSLSMDKHQDNWARNIDSFVSQFTKTADVDYHVGVTLIYDSIHWGVNVDANKNQVSCNPPGAPVKHPVGELIPLKMSVNENGHEVLKTIDGPRYLTKDSADINNILGATLRVGVIPPSKDGPEFEEMFTPVIHAFTSACQNNPTNAGFYRPDAHLVVIFITDADDSSPVIKKDEATGIPKITPSWISPDDMYASLKNLKGGDASKVMVVGALSPIDEPDCAMDPSGKPFRNTHLVNLSGGSVLSLCSRNFGQKLAEVGDKIVQQVRRTVIKLHGVPDRNQTFTVMYGNQEIPADAQKGWSYDANEKTLVISGSADIKIQPGVKITYSFTPINLANEGTKRVIRKGHTGSDTAPVNPVPTTN